MPRREQSESALVELFRAIAAGEAAKVKEALERSPRLATEATTVGASAASALPCFLSEIQHYFYAGDTALHIAAASYNGRLVSRLIHLGAACSVRNRRGAEPLHYASDTNHIDSEAQAETIRILCAAGANPNALDNSGVAPLHRAVRTRGAAAVRTLLAAGADSRLKNTSGSTPLHLAVQNTGRGGTGSPWSKEQQQQVIVHLLTHGASLTDKNGRGKTVVDAASEEWIVAVLKAPVDRRVT